jgi:hypothetical protein
MYLTVLLLHSWLRWVVIVIALLVVVRAVSGIGSKRPWNAADERGAKLFTITLDIQLLLGLLMYFALSPITREAMRDFGAAMKIPGMRFYAAEHVFGMLVAIALAHRGLARVRSIQDPVRKHRVAAVFFILALLALLVSTPWPGMPYGRPLFRW